VTATRKFSMFNLAVLLALVAAWDVFMVIPMAWFSPWVTLPILLLGAFGIGYWTGSPFPVRIEISTHQPRLRYLPSILLAMAWTLVWGTWNLVHCWKDWCLHPSTFRYYRSLAFTWGRHDSPKAVTCTECGWAGPLRWMLHSYDGDGCGDVEPVDRCPACGQTEEYQPLLTANNGVWSS